LDKIKLIRSFIYFTKCSTYQIADEFYTYIDYYLEFVGDILEPGTVGTSNMEE